MKIYVAGSFKHGELCREVGRLLRLAGHIVYVFCDLHETTYNVGIELRRSGTFETLNPQNALQNAMVKKLYELNMAQLDTCDVVVVVLPCGRSAHLEAGYVKGKGKPVYVYGKMITGELDAMYGMVDGIYGEDELGLLIDKLV